MCLDLDLHLHTGAPTGSGTPAALGVAWIFLQTHTRMIIIQDVKHHAIGACIHSIRKQYLLDSAHTCQQVTDHLIVDKARCFTCIFVNIHERLIRVPAWSKL